MLDREIRLRKFIYGAVCCGVILAMPTVLLSCGSHDSHDGHDHENEAEMHSKSGHESEDKKGTHADAGAIHMEPEDAEHYGVTVVDIVSGEFRDAVKSAAEILPSASDVATASAPTSGMVTLAPGITQGCTVKAGQTIARIKASGVSGGDANASGKAALDNAKRELDRLTPLLKDGLITKKEYNDALAAYELAKASYSPQAATGVVTAPRAGVLTGIVAGEGAFVNTGDPVALISGSGRLTLRALLPVRDASLLPMLSGVVITPHGGNGESVDLSEYGGKLLSSSASSSTEMPGYIPVYFTFDNSAPVVAGSAAEVYLRGVSRSGVISVPVAALSEQLGEKFVYVKTGGNEYEKRHVEVGALNGTDAEILSGLHEGDKVVVGGVSFVRLAEQSTVVPEGHSHNH